MLLLTSIAVAGVGSTAGYAEHSYMSMERRITAWPLSVHGQLLTQCLKLPDTFCSTKPT
jgi:hypothetical protein